MKTSKWFAGLLCSMIVSTTAQAVVWQDTETWNEAQEQKFDRWIEQLPLDIFADRKSPWYGISTDCADAVYALRIIFAYENKLPVQFRIKDFPFLNNRTDRFDKGRDGKELDEMTRVRRFINSVSYHTNTRTLIQDTYPIAVRRGSVAPGAMFAHPESGRETPVSYRPGHVYYVQEVLPNGVIKYISSTVPTMVRKLTPRWGIHFAPLFQKSGFRRWIWPQFQNEQSKMPSYDANGNRFAGWSEKQFNNDRMKSAWQAQLEVRLRTPGQRGATSRERVGYAAQNVEFALLERANIVQTGWSIFSRKYQKKADARGRICMDKGEYDNYSTPTRDKKIQYELSLMRAAIRRYFDEGHHPCPGRGWSPDSLECRNIGLSNILRSHKVEVIPARVRNGVKLPAVVKDFEYIQNLFNSAREPEYFRYAALWISEPEHSPEVRWGLEPLTECPCPHRMHEYKGRHEKEDVVAYLPPQCRTK